MNFVCFVFQTHRSRTGIASAPVVSPTRRLRPLSDAMHCVNSATLRLCGSAFSLSAVPASHLKSDCLCRPVTDRRNKVRLFSCLVDERSSSSAASCAPWASLPLGSCTPPRFSGPVLPAWRRQSRSKPAGRSKSRTRVSASGRRDSGPEGSRHRLQGLNWFRSRDSMRGGGGHR